MTGTQNAEGRVRKGEAQIRGRESQDQHSTMRAYGCRMSSGLPDSDEQIDQKIDGTVESFGNGTEECRLEHRKEV